MVALYPAQFTMAAIGWQSRLCTRISASPYPILFAIAQNHFLAGDIEPAIDKSAVGSWCNDRLLRE